MGGRRGGARAPLARTHGVCCPIDRDPGSIIGLVLTPVMIIVLAHVCPETCADSPKFVSFHGRLARAYISIRIELDELA